VGERRACRAASQPRATQRLPPRPVAAPVELLRQRVRAISRKWPRWGFRRAGAVLRMEGWKVNHKRVQRLWREEGLRVPQHSPKRRRLGNSTVPVRISEQSDHSFRWNPIGHFGAIRSAQG
jgi:transposase InsO family protein